MSNKSDLLTAPSDSIEFQDGNSDVDREKCVIVHIIYSLVEL
jgi:hypothetical protein